MRSNRLESTLRKSQGSGRTISAWSGLLAIGALILGALPAQAQSWIVQDQNGHAIVPASPNGPYPLGGTITNTGQLGGNYAAAQAYIQSNQLSGVQLAYQITPGLNTVVPGPTDMSVNASIGSGFYGPNNLLYNGTLKGTVTGQLRAYWKWTYPQGNIPPKSINLLLSTYLGGSAAGTSHTLEGVPTSGLSADITLTDEVNGTGFNETAAAWEGDNGVKGSTFGGWIPNTPCHSSVVSGTHLVTAQVDPVTGLAEVYLNGLITYALSDSLSNWSDDPCEIDGYLDADAQLISANIQGYSTHCAPSLNYSDSNWTSYQPRYFSGTGCEVDSTAVPASGYLTHAQLCIVDITGKDQVVKEYWYQGAPGCPTSVPSDGSIVIGTSTTPGAGVNLNARFDSTHFQDGSMIVLKLKVWDSKTGYYDGVIQGPAKNRLYAYADQTPTHYPVINSYAQKVNHDVLTDIQNDATYMNYFPLTTENDAKNAVLSTIPIYTAMYVGSHGFTNSFGDCYATLDSSNNYYIDYTDVEPAVEVKSKNLNLPPYNFVFLDCCNTAGESPSLSLTLASAFLNGDQSSPDGLSDRAFLGWKNIILAIGQNARWTKNVFDFLSVGYTLSDATHLATLTFPEIGTLSEDLPGAAIPIFIYPEIYGDTKTTMHGVYGGVGTGYDIKWFRPL